MKIDGKLPNSKVYQKKLATLKSPWQSKNGLFVVIIKSNTYNIDQETILEKTKR